LWPFSWLRISNISWRKKAVSGIVNPRQSQDSIVRICHPWPRGPKTANRARPAGKCLALPRPSTCANFGRRERRTRAQPEGRLSEEAQLLRAGAVAFRTKRQSLPGSGTEGPESSVGERSARLGPGESQSVPKGRRMPLAFHPRAGRLAARIPRPAECGAESHPQPGPLLQEHTRRREPTSLPAGLQSS
jgi:hypothetical protein